MTSRIKIVAMAQYMIHKLKTGKRSGKTISDTTSK